MKLLCDISVGNRLATNVKRKHAKSTLALCKEPKSKNFYIILFAGQSKNSTKYNVKDNINQIFAKYLHEGKATIQFKEPPHDLYIQAESINLKGFLHLLKRVLEQKVSEKELSFSSMSVTPISKKNIPPTKLVIKNRSEYPLKGFPRSLEALHITDIEKCSVDRSILNLTKLKVLNLSNNCIDCLPQELSQFECLAELNISNNQLGKCSPKQWAWIGGKLSKTLKLLNLSGNGLKFLPEQLVKLHTLAYLHIDKNKLQVLPSGIGNLKQLQILTASDNMLAALPGSVRSWRLQRLDVSNNAFLPDQEEVRRPIALPKTPVCSLKELAARNFLLTKVPYDKEALPMTLVDYLDYAKYCVCGKACFVSFIKYSQTLQLSSIARNLNLSSPRLQVVPIDCYFCSLKCFLSVCYVHTRHSVI